MILYMCINMFTLFTLHGFMYIVSYTPIALFYLLLVRCCFFPFLFHSVLVIRVAQKMEASECVCHKEKQQVC
jgi:hypothetical protein